MNPVARAFLDGISLPAGWVWESSASPYGVRSGICGDIRVTLMVNANGSYKIHSDLGAGNAPVVYNDVPQSDIERSLKEVCRVTLRRVVS